MLYGSYAKNRWNQNSDIDLAVFISDPKHGGSSAGKESLRECYRLLSSYCYEYSLDVQLQVFHESELLNPMGIIEEVLECGIEITHWEMPQGSMGYSE